eukprot:3539249-Amphidinium_carterae.1
MGMLQLSDLGESEFWIRQRLFVACLLRAAPVHEALLELSLDLTLSTRILSLPTDDSLESGEEHEWFAFGSHLHPASQEAVVDCGNLQPFTYGDHELMISENGVLFQPPNEVPVGIWNEGEQRIEPMRAIMESEDGTPVAVLSFWGSTFLMDAEQRVIDPATQKVVGIFNAETMDILPMEEHIEISTPGPEERGLESHTRGSSNQVAM